MKPLRRTEAADLILMLAVLIGAFMRGSLSAVHVPLTTRP